MSDKIILVHRYAQKRRRFLEPRSVLLPIRIPPIRNFEGNWPPPATCFQLADSFIYRSIASVHASFDLSVSGLYQPKTATADLMMPPSGLRRI